ncbi:MAG: hypothetical protein G3I10_04500 [Ferrovum sp.]|nr:hypothetical protein [Ferrovum sp.]
MKRPWMVAALAVVLAGGCALAPAQSQNSNGSGSAPSGGAKEKAGGKKQAKDKRPHPIQEQWGCNYGSTGSGASATTTNGVLISLKDGCPNPLQKTFSIITPALMIGKNAYVFGYHTDAEARMVADVFCQRAGGQFLNTGGGSVTSGGLNLNNFQYADSHFAVQPFDPKSNRDLALNILSLIVCQR